MPRRMGRGQTKSPSLLHGAWRPGLHQLQPKNRANLIRRFESHVFPIEEPTQPACAHAGLPGHLTQGQATRFHRHAQPVGQGNTGRLDTWHTTPLGRGSASLVLLPLFCFGMRHRVANLLSCAKTKIGQLPSPRPMAWKYTGISGHCRMAHTTAWNLTSSARSGQRWAHWCEVSPSTNSSASQTVSLQVSQRSLSGCKGSVEKVEMGHFSFFRGRRLISTWAKNSRTSTALPSWPSASITTKGIPFTRLYRRVKSRSPRAIESTLHSGPRSFTFA